MHISKDRQDTVRKKEVSESALIEFHHDQREGDGGFSAGIFVIADCQFTADESLVKEYAAFRKEIENGRNYF